jgi:hypothetical protein
MTLTETRYPFLTRAMGPGDPSVGIVLRRDADAFSRVRIRRIILGLLCAAAALATASYTRAQKQDPIGPGL